MLTNGIKPPRDSAKLHSYVDARQRRPGTKVGKPKPGKDIATA
jgi:hypothetical protein